MSERMAVMFTCFGMFVGSASSILANPFAVVLVTVILYTTYEVFRK